MTSVALRGPSRVQFPHQTPANVIAINVSALVAPDELILDALVRLQLAAQRLGASIELHHACTRLVDLIALVGLSDVLPVAVDGD